MKTYKVLIIGSGFGGQVAAINLKKTGISDFLILERRDFLGGTWCQNSYPGAAVDVHSPLYSISSEPYQWTQMFAERDELTEYTHHVLDKHGLKEKTHLNANVTGLKWIDAEKLWEVSTETQGTFHGQFVINASGPLSNPVIPNFPGRESFQGKSFHTNGWDHSYDYSNKRVAIIGSGASAAQVIPAIAPSVAHLHVFQRTPHWVLPRPDRKFSAFERKLLGSKFYYTALRWAIYWKLETRVIGFKWSRKLLKIFAQRHAENHIAQSFSDPVLRKKVTPEFTIGCKRVILSSTLYPALNRANVTLHDKNQAIKEITPTGIITQDGENLALDLIIYSTGYDATDGALSYPIIGKDGVSAAAAWAQFPRAYLGTTLPKFPNFFVMTGPNTGIGHTSAIFIIEAQANYIINSIQAVHNSNKQAIEVTAKAENDYTTMIHTEMDKTVWKDGGCNSWYKSKDGHVIAMFPGFSFTYYKLASNFKAADHIFS